MPIKTLINALIFCVLATSNSSLAEVKYQLEPLAPLHHQSMANQKDKISALLRTHTGSNLRGDLSDIRNMQRLLDTRVVASNDIASLQAMGIALGDVLVKQLKLHWVIYEDQLGRNKALQYRDNTHFLFPVTMLSRRGTGGADINIQAIYDKAAKTMEPYINSGPFIYPDL